MMGEQAESRGDSRRAASAKAYRFAYPLGRIAPTRHCSFELSLVLAYVKSE
jgi:hypothetical protein